MNIESTPENSVVLYLVSRGANINERDNYGCTALHFAAMRGNELVTYELIMCKGVNIEVSYNLFTARGVINAIPLICSNCQILNIRHNSRSVVT